MKLKNKVVVITGGATGIGLACTKLFIREGAKVAIFGRRKDKLERTASECGENVLAIQGDITQEKDLDHLVGKTLEKWQRIDVLVNNAGVFTGAPIHEMENNQWDAVFDVNIRGVFMLTKKALARMVEQKSGTIVHISSILGQIAIPQAAAYNASKGALIQFSRSIAVEYGNLGIRSNTVCPALIATDMTTDLMKNEELMKEWIKSYPIGRFGVPEDIAHACLYLASDEASFVTGAVLPVDGGYTAL